ncbi:MAG: hypothetical protein ACPGVU_21620 [Limisphaerales bacterium]
MPTDLEVAEEDEAAGNDRPVIPRGRIIAFALLAITFVIVAVLSSFQKQPTERADWVEHAPGVAIYRIDQPHLKGKMFEISEKYADVHDDLCHQLKLPTTGGATFRGRTIFLGLGRSHFGRIPGDLTGTNQFTVFGCRDGARSYVALVEGNPRHAPAHLLLLEHQAEAKHVYHTAHLSTPDDFLFPTVKTRFGPTAYLTGSTMMTGEPFTNVVNFYETKFRPQRSGTGKASAVRIPPADGMRKDTYTIWLQTTYGPKLIRVTDDGGFGYLTVVNFRL